ELADGGADVGLDGLVALGRDLVGLDALELGLDVCHEERLSERSVVAVEGGSRSSGPGVGTPLREPRLGGATCAHDLSAHARTKVTSGPVRQAKRPYAGRPPGAQPSPAAFSRVIVRTARSTA